MVSDTNRPASHRLVSPRLRSNARSLRRRMTEAERRLWWGLRHRRIEGFRFRRQVPIEGFIADFACHEARLIIEVDGATHSTTKEMSYDRERESRLRMCGYDVLHIWNREIYDDLGGVLETIRLRLARNSTPHPNPPPLRGRE
ncbi:endonuclease domain-containing protein [Chelatococcus sp. GCM10030263]|uniref:endonuclease domain-containing protein n=1 Tax=Chelatococcus sp. GCM10030263 TaxID=3273387 RepID=UPI0036221A13